MKRNELIRHLLESGCVLEKEGKKHTMFYDPKSGKLSTIPRHKEINTFTAKEICKDLEIEIIKKK